MWPILDGIPFENLGTSRLQIDEDEYNISIDIQNVFIDKTEESITKLNDTDRVKNWNILDSLIYKN